MNARSKVAGSARNGRRLYRALVPIACGKFGAEPHTIAQGQLFTRRQQIGGGRNRSYAICRACEPFEER
jgi:hypothetical protein